MSIKEYKSRTGQLLNHFPQTDVLTRKGHLQIALKAASIDHGSAYNFFPRSFAVNRTSFPFVKKYASEMNTIWIGKPAHLSRGRGIMISRNVDDFFPSFSQQESLFVLQEYLSNPHLIGGYKHDMRIYVLVTSIMPLTVHLYNEGLSRFCCEKYSLDDFSTLKHLTNTSINHKLWRSGKLNMETANEFNNTVDSCLGPGDFTKRKLRTMLSYIGNSGINAQQIWNQVQKNIILTLVTLFTEENYPNLKCFELLGFDFLLTDTLDVVLLEVNLGPSMEVACMTDASVKYALLSDMIELVTKGKYTSRRFPSLSEKPLQSNGDFDKIFPFNKKTEIASKEISEGKNLQENMRIIIEETCEYFGHNSTINQSNLNFKENQLKTVEL
jgi:tubulin polyglutamylase TTLL2